MSQQVVRQPVGAVSTSLVYNDLEFDTNPAWEIGSPTGLIRFTGKKQEISTAQRNMVDSSTEQTTSQPHVLLIDDDAEIIDSMRYALETNDFRVSIARDGNQGLALAEKASPDLLILDMMMPKRSGFLVLEQLRREGNEALRVIMITGNEGNRHQQYAELLGVDDYIRKPFPMDRLVETAKRLVGRKSRHDP